MEEKALTSAQKQILSKVISKADSSTFTLCVNEEQEAQLDLWRRLKNQFKDKQLSPQDEAEIDKVKDAVIEIYKSAVYCPYCGKLAEVSGDLDFKGNDSVSFSCSCEDAVKEKESKIEINEQHKKLDEKFFDIQVAATNKAIETYKKHYKDIIEFRRKAFEKLDDEILNAPSL